MAPTHIRGRLRKADGGSTPASLQCLGAAQFNARFSAVAYEFAPRPARLVGITTNPDRVAPRRPSVTGPSK